MGGEDRWEGSTMTIEGHTNISYLIIISNKKKIGQNLTFFLLLLRVYTCVHTCVRTCVCAGDVPLDMRGRCSAGQRVLAAIVIR